MISKKFKFCFFDEKAIILKKEIDCFRKKKCEFNSRFMPKISLGQFWPSCRKKLR